MNFFPYRCVPTPPPANPTPLIVEALKDLSFQTSQNQGFKFFKAPSNSLFYFRMLHLMYFFFLLLLFTQEAVLFQFAQRWDWVLKPLLCILLHTNHLKDLVVCTPSTVLTNCLPLERERNKARKCIFNV